MSGLDGLGWPQEGCPQCGSARGYSPADMVDNGVGLEKCGPAHCEECGWIEPTFDEVLHSQHNAESIHPESKP